MKDQVLDNVLKRWEEVTEIPTQTIGPFTNLYKEVTKRLKVFPWIPLLFVSILVSLGLFTLFGTKAIRIVSILQRGF